MIRAQVESTPALLPEGSSEGTRKACSGKTRQSVQP